MATGPDRLIRRLPLHINDPEFARALVEEFLGFEPGTHRGPIVMPESRATIMERLHKKVAAGLPIIGGGAGTGISAKCEEAGGIDLIVIYNSGRFRMAGRGSLAGLMPYGNANAIVKEMAYEVLTAVESHARTRRRVRHRPVHDPRPVSCASSRTWGSPAFRTFPTVGLIDGTLRVNLEETGMGFSHEIDCIAAAHELDLLTTPYAFDAEQARLLAEAGADIVVAHMGLTTKGSIGARTAKTLDDCVREVTEIAQAGKSGSRRSARPVSWRADRLAGRCSIHPRAGSRYRRLLWCELDGAAADRAGHRPAGSRLHGPETQALDFVILVILPLVLLREIAQKLTWRIVDRIASARVGRLGGCKMVAWLPGIWQTSTP